MLDPDNLLPALLPEPVEWELQTFQDQIEMWDNRPERVITITFRRPEPKDVVEEPGDE